MRIKCKFRPQAWIDDYAYNIDLSDFPDPNWWEMDVTVLPRANSYESDALRERPEAPEWVRTYRGPFEVDFEEIA